MFFASDWESEGTHYPCPHTCHRWRLMIKSPYITCILSYVVTAKGMSGTIHKSSEFQDIHMLLGLSTFFFLNFGNFFFKQFPWVLIPPQNEKRIKMTYIKCSGGWCSNFIRFMWEKIEMVMFTSIIKMWNNTWSYVSVITNSPAVWITSMASTLKCINCRLSWSQSYIFF